MPANRTERANLALRDGLAWLWQPFKWLCIAALALVVIGVGAWLIGEGCHYLEAKERKKQAQRVASCARYDNVRIDGILRLQSIEKVYGEGTDRQFFPGWRVYQQVPNSPEIGMHDNACSYRLVADVPADQLMWALQSSRMAGKRCDCSIVYHIRSMTDPAISTAERGFQ